MRVDWRNPRHVLAVIAVLCLLAAAGGAAAAFHNRNKTICPDGKAPVAQQGGLLGQVEYRCHNGDVVTESD